MLSANDGKIINTLANKSRMSISLVLESGLSGPDAVSTSSMPIIPNVTEAMINILVAIFCIVLV